METPVPFRSFTVADQPKKHRTGKQKKNEQYRDYDQLHDSKERSYKRKEKYQNWKHEYQEQENDE
jgi:hypothetical protein